MIRAELIAPFEYQLVDEHQPLAARVFADATLIEAIMRDHSLQQLANVRALPGVYGDVYGMPDMHEGYGFPVGGVAATELPDGAISPGGIGFDINCGVRLMTSNLDRASFAPLRERIVHDISRTIPSGYGRGGRLALDDDALCRVLGSGCRELVTHLGFGIAEDLEVIESGGALEGADPTAVSVRALARGRDQLGTLGGGNHFVEVGAVDTIFDADAAHVLGLRADQITLIVHTGSRGLGHQVCSDYLALMDTAQARYGITLPDRQLACAPLSSPEGQRYFAAMRAAANFAFANRQLISHRVRAVLCPTSYVLLGTDAAEARSLASVCHGAGRVLSRGAAKRQLTGHALRKELEARGITVRCPSNAELAEEAPEAYKDIDRVVDVVVGAGLARKVARLVPLGVVKG